MANYITTDTELQSVANAIRTKGGTSSQLVYPTGFVSAIEDIPTGGSTDPDAWKFNDGNYDYFNYRGYFSRALNANKSDFRMNNITSLKNAFVGIPDDEYKNLDLYLGERMSWKSGQYIDIAAFGYDANYQGINYMTYLPSVMGTNDIRLRIGTSTFRELQYITSFQGFLKNNSVYASTGAVTNFCAGCNRLRSFDKNFWMTPEKAAEIGTNVVGTSYGYWFASCYVLDRLENIPVLGGSTTASNAFTSFLQNGMRLDKITFLTNNGTPYNINITRNLTWNLSNGTGWCSNSAWNLEMYGIPANKEVTDAASYQRLKNDPDWWTKDVTYSRFNHDSAVALINSLPNNTNTTYKVTIELKGTAGSNTDGGAINTLTSSEIAVATNKNWAINIV